MEDLSIKDAAQLLRVSEETVLRWIRQGVVPTHKSQGEFRFERGELESWARRNRIGSRAAASGTGSDERVDLLEAVERGGVHSGIPGTTPEAVFRAMLKAFPFPRDSTDVPREALLSSLLEREALMSTGVGSGIALPHPRHPQDWGLAGPTVGVMLLQQPVDFGALDGKPVDTLFVILCATVKGHLQMLSQVTHFVHDSAVRAFLAAKPGREALLQRVRDAAS